jgi:hypothetical protein
MGGTGTADHQQEVPAAMRGRSHGNGPRKLSDEAFRQIRRDLDVHGRHTQRLAERPSHVVARWLVTIPTATTITAQLWSALARPTISKVQGAQAMIE